VLKNFKSGNFDSASIMFKKAIQNTNGLPDHNYALVVSTLSAVYMQKKEYDEAINLLLEAAISDVQSSTKETTALYNVSSLLFDKGDINNALMCIEKANADALFYGARQRKIQIGSVLPRIEGQFITTIELQKRNLERYAIIITVLFVVVIGLVLIIYQQLKKLSVAKNLIVEAHQKEKEINLLLNEANTIKEQFNQQLIASNISLKESNKIKEEYIGYFFHIDYSLLEKFEKFKTTIEKKLVERKFDDIRFIINKTNIEKEKGDLLLTFDKTFVKLFPNFVKEFNSLFSKENQITLKDDELLNTELRIFALIRLGISDTEKIAQILNYSVNTIYTYKTKVRNKSLVSKDEFDQKLYEATHIGA
jgi:tetratricopeptide (TPR) repeat protein